MLSHSQTEAALITDSNKLCKGATYICSFYFLDLDTFSEMLTKIPLDIRLEILHHNYYVSTSIFLCKCL